MKLCSGVYPAAICTPSVRRPALPRSDAESRRRYGIQHGTGSAMSRLRVLGLPCNPDRWAASSSSQAPLGSGNPLYRNSGGAEKDYNRQISCPKALKRPTGYECDEYPFASTTMGGGKAAPADRYVGWVPAAENHLQGGLLSTFFSAGRVFPAFTYGGQGDPFYVYV